MKGVGKKVGEVSPLCFEARRIGIGKVITGDVDRSFGGCHAGAGGNDCGFETDTHCFVVM